MEIESLRTLGLPVPTIIVDLVNINKDIFIYMSQLSRWTRSRKQMKKFHKRILENKNAILKAKAINDELLLQTRDNRKD